MSDDLFSDRKYIKRRDDSRNHSWQFQFEVDPIKESKSFADSHSGSKEASFLKAKKYRDDFLKSAMELGLIGPDGKPIRSNLPFLITLSPRNTSGIVGIYREHLLRKGKQPQMSWVANYQEGAGKNRQKTFPIRSLGEKEALRRSLKFRRDFVASASSLIQSPDKKALVDKHVDDLDFLLEYVDALQDGPDIFFFLSTLNNPQVTATEKQDMLAQRIGQERFRRFVLGIWGGKCAVTGATQFLTAGHIKPWSNSTDAERLDPYNGLALSPVYDKAFDAGLITFTQEGRIVVSSLLAADSVRLSVTGREVIHGLTEQHLAYLEYHRRERFHA